MPNQDGRLVAAELRDTVRWDSRTLTGGSVTRFGGHAPIRSAPLGLIQASCSVVLIRRPELVMVARPLVHFAIARRKRSAF